MKKLMIVLALSAVTGSAMAQLERARKPRTASDTTSTGARVNVKEDKQSRKEMMRELSLTKEQKGKFKEMQQGMKAKKEAIENDDKLSDTEKKEKLRELRKEQMKATGSILNDEQREKMKQMRKDKMKEMKGNKEAKMENEEVL